MGTACRGEGVWCGEVFMMVWWSQAVCSRVTAHLETKETWGVGVDREREREREREKREREGRRERDEWGR